MSLSTNFLVIVLKKKKSLKVRKKDGVVRNECAEDVEVLTMRWFLLVDRFRYQLF